jgi:hypothetical protein
MIRKSTDLGFFFYKFRYSGQWWYIGNIVPKLLTIAFPFWMMYLILDEADRRKKDGRQGLASWQHIPEFPNSSKTASPEF